MFRRKRTDGEDDGTDQFAPADLIAPPAPPVPPPASAAPLEPAGQGSTSQNQYPLRQGTPPAPQTAQTQAATTVPNRIPTMPPRPTAADIARPADVLRRPSELAAGSGIGAPSPSAAPSIPPMREAEVRQLIVGREISLQGEIRACDRLLIEGSVEANLQSCHDFNIAETGLFKGTALIDDAEIRGRFEGTLTVRSRLFIRSTGKVSGTVRYGQIEIECGGQISGDIQAEGPAANGLAASTDHAPQGVTELGATTLN